MVSEGCRLNPESFLFSLSGKMLRSGFSVIDLLLTVVEPFKSKVWWVFHASFQGLPLPLCSQAGRWGGKGKGAGSALGLDVELIWQGNSPDQVRKDLGKANQLEFLPNCSSHQHSQCSSSSSIYWDEGSNIAIREKVCGHVEGLP